MFCLVKMTEGITKRDSLFLYGVAIILMVYHHLFCIPSRIQFEYFSTLDYIFPFSNFSVERNLAYFSKLCVAIFAFITGYGMARTLNNSESNPLKRLFNDYVRIFIKAAKLIFKIFLVLSIYVPLLIIIKNADVTFAEYIKNVFTLSSSLCGEYWYAVFYTRVLLFIPLLNLIFSKNKGNTLAKILYIILPVSFIVCAYIFCPASPNLIYSVIILEGFICARFKIFEFISSKLNKKLELFLSIFVLFGIIITRLFLQDEAGYNFIDQLIIVPFVYCSLVICKKVKFVYCPLCFIGKYSTFIWLTHTLIAYSLFTRFITISGISTVIFIQTFVISCVVAIVFMYLEKGICKLFKLMCTKFLKI